MIQFILSDGVIALEYSRAVLHKGGVSVDESYNRGDLDEGFDIGVCEVVVVLGCGVGWEFVEVA